MLNTDLLTKFAYDLSVKAQVLPYKACPLSLN